MDCQYYYASTEAPHAGPHSEQLRQILRQQSPAALTHLAISLCEKAITNVQQELQNAVTCYMGCDSQAAPEALLRAEAAMHVAMRRMCLAKRLVAVMSRKAPSPLQHPQYSCDDDDGEEVCSSYTPIADC